MSPGRSSVDKREPGPGQAAGNGHERGASDRQGSGSRERRRSASSRGSLVHKPSPCSRSASVARAPQPSTGRERRSPEPQGRERSRSRGPIDVRSRSRSLRGPAGDGRRPGFDDRRLERSDGGDGFRSPRPRDDGYDQRREWGSPRPEAVFDGFRSPTKPSGWGSRGDSRGRSASRTRRQPPRQRDGAKRDGDPPHRRADQLCIPWATGRCRKGNDCKDGHPPPEESKRILEVIQKRPCRFGKECRRADCIFWHREERDLPRQNAR